MIRQSHQKRIVAAVPVAPFYTANKIRNPVDDLICLNAPKQFFDAGQFYNDFTQVTDEEVIDL